jgi:urease alpha subunit
MIRNDGAMPKIQIDPKTDVRVDSELLVCGPADKLPMEQRCFSF